MKTEKTFTIDKISNCRNSGRKLLLPKEDQKYPLGFKTMHIHCLLDMVYNQFYWSSLPAHNYNVKFLIHPSTNSLKMTSEKLPLNGKRCPIPAISWYRIHGSFSEIYRLSLYGIIISSKPCQMWTEPSLLGNGFATSVGSNSHFPNPIIMSRTKDS